LSADIEFGVPSSPPPPPEAKVAAEEAAIRRERRKKKPARVFRDEMTELADDVIRAALQDTSDIVTIRPTIAWPEVARATLGEALRFSMVMGLWDGQRLEEITELFRQQCEAPTGPAPEELTAEQLTEGEETTSLPSYSAVE
jgi:hypothetical protein